MEDKKGLEIWRLIHQLLRTHKKLYRVTNLTGLETRVLFTANHYQKDHEFGITIRDLKDKLHVSSPTISQVINDLEKRDIVKRVKDERDGRITRIEVCPTGKEELQKAVQVVESHFVALGDYLGEEKSTLLIELLTETNTFFENEDNL